MKGPSEKDKRSGRGRYSKSDKGEEGRDGLHLSPKTFFR